MEKSPSARMDYSVMEAKNYYGLKFFYETQQIKLVESYSLIRPAKRKSKQVLTIWFNSEKERNDYLAKSK
jgi:hypothetical protein